MSQISTHVLDTTAGRPAGGIPVRLYLDDRQVGAGVTNQDGRCVALLENSVKLEAGIYRITFEIADKFPNSFYPKVEISFRVRDSGAHYHIPLLLSPFGYTTYRGS
ncbi:MAG TPA: hydroxyisourate hydrolase [Bryobacteraceae bacterium]|jgi:5-hydroxyisourate hydrolase|nr:hydroxyisourate hydrolase [Bryobacteraceae bacterium]